MKKWKVQLSDVDFSEREFSAVLKVLKSGWLTMGPVTQRFEKAFAGYLDVKYAFAVANGTAALHIANLAIGLKEGDEVICPSLSFVATANTILYTGATPVFADIVSLDDWTISPDDIKGKITSKTKAIMVMHYGGYPCRMDEIMAVARQHNLLVIEDAAHAVGSEYQGRKCGTIGDIGCFSFYSNKNMTTGEGGMIVTNNDGLAQEIALFRSHGMTSLTWDRHRGASPLYDVTTPGFNYRIDEIRSAIGLVQLKRLEGNNRKRAKLVRRYREALKSVPGISIPFRNCTGNLSYHLFPILLERGIDRNRVVGLMEQAGIQTSVHYPPIHLFSYYRKRFGTVPAMFPLTEEVGRRELTLPLGSGFSERTVISVANTLKRGLQHLR